MILFRNITRLMACNARRIPRAQRMIQWFIVGLLAAAVVVTWLG